MFLFPSFGHLSTYLFFQGIIGNDVILCLDTEITEKQQKMYL